MSKYIIEIDDNDLTELKGRYRTFANGVVQRLINSFLGAVTEEEGAEALELLDREAYFLAGKLSLLLDAARPEATGTVTELAAIR